MNDRGKLNLDAIKAAAQVPETEHKATKVAHFSFTYTTEKNLRKRAKTCALANDMTLSNFMEEAVEVALHKYET